MNLCLAHPKTLFAIKEMNLKQSIVYNSNPYKENQSNEESNLPQSSFC